MSSDKARGRFCWYDLMTSDVEAAKAFYTELIGWEIEIWEGGDTPYAMWKGPTGPLGGVMTLPQEAEKMGAPPHWMAYIATPDIETTSTKARELGGRILVPPTEMMLLPSLNSVSLFMPNLTPSSLEKSLLAITMRDSIST